VTDGGDEALNRARAALRERQGSGARYDAENAPSVELGWCRLGMAYVSRVLGGLSDADLAGASNRPGWSRRRVVAASALQAREMAQAITGAAGGPVDELVETDAAALDLAETLPPRALRDLARHADVHLDVVWRDLQSAQWDLPIVGVSGASTPRQTALLRAHTLWRSAFAIFPGVPRLRDAPADMRAALAS
jgi:maleylpyruvate isomerase